jgi:SAM-dependent methyltransferase
MPQKRRAAAQTLVWMCSTQHAMDHAQEQNRRSWNAVVPVHNSHRTHLAPFFRAGGSTLFAEELTLLGDICGKHVAHLLCNTGQDTLSLAQRGAIVTGVDISDEAIHSAMQLVRDTGIAATFVRSDVYDWLQHAARAGQHFDVVYCAYGVICWLHDLQAWAQGVAAILPGGGRFVLVEFHPVSNMFDHNWQLANPYGKNGRALHLPGVGDYVGASAGGLTPSGFVAGIEQFENPEPCVLYQWGVGEVVTALANAGLSVTQLQEYPYVNGERPFANMREDHQRRMFPPANVPSIPLMYGVVAVKRH